MFLETFLLYDSHLVEYLKALNYMNVCMHIAYCIDHSLVDSLLSLLYIFVNKVGSHLIMQDPDRASDPCIAFSRMMAGRPSQPKPSLGLFSSSSMSYGFYWWWIHHVCNIYLTWVCPWLDLFSISARSVRS